MKKSVTCNQSYISYSLERQVEDQCKKRNIYHNTPVEEILDQWNDNFEDETLTLVPNEYRRLVARWIKWSLMINNLRESLARQTAIGVIGLVNSGKSKFVRSLFGKEVRK
jgi:polynucleotide 5'-kinase involved in rRNA processing